MKIVAFGASGQCGLHFVRHAASRGHQITAIVRGTFEALPNVRVHKADPLDADAVRACIANHDAVFSGLGMRYKHPWATRESPDDFTSRCAQNIVDGMLHHNVRRLSFISAAGIGDSRPGLNLPMRLMLRFSNVGVAYADLERAEELIRKSTLDYQLVRPVTLSNKPATQRVQLVDHFSATAQIPREDVALFLLNELEKPSFTSRTPQIAAQ